MRIPNFITALVLGCLAGCGAPNRANIDLRKENQTLHEQVDQLKQRLAGDERTITGLRQQHGSLQTLSADRLEKLYTVHGLDFGRLTGGADLDPKKPGDEGIVVYIIPLDQEGQKIKAAGTFVIEAFDLAAPGNPRIGRWTFDLEQSRQAWNGWFLEYNYVLICPWQTVPKHSDLTVKVTFNDELTDTPFNAQRQVHVDLPPTTQPSAG